MKKFAVFVSGNGTNLQAIINAVKKGEITAILQMVITDKPDAPALKRAEEAGIHNICVSPKDFTNKQSVDRQLVIDLKEQKIDFIVLAGYMRLFTPFFVKQYPQKIINIHPSLLPSFRGKQGIKDAFTYGAKVTGATVHFVDEKMDHGPIIMQDSVKIQDNDTLESLEEKIHKIEYRILPKSIQLYAEGRLKVKRRKVIVLDSPPAKPPAKATV